MIWNIDISIEPSGRDFNTQVAADEGKEAVRAALERLEMDPGEMIHVIHVSRPRACNNS
jgi:hypothetical protein